MRWSSVLSILGSVLCFEAAHAQKPVEPFHVRKPSFRVPFEIDEKEQSRLKEVQLYVSEDRGKNWRPAGRVGPTERFFQFRSDRDGPYAFLVRTVDIDGRAYPPSLEGAKPGLQVVVDTVLPVVSLRALPPRGDELGIEWDARDEHLDAASVTVEIRPPGSDWQALQVEPSARGQHYFSARPPIEARVRVLDRAENQGSAALTLQGNGVATPLNPRRDPPQAISTTTPRPSNQAMHIINSLELTLKYSIEDVGPSGVSSVELWMTRDGKSWQKLSEDEDRVSPIQARLPEEGVYGLSLVVRSGAGLGDRPPRTGEAAQMWVEVDRTAPTVKLQSAEPARGFEGTILTVTWSASDKNLAPQPVSLLYADRPEGPWQTMVAGLDNTGRYQWRVPGSFPYQFYLRIEALDRAGNVGRDESNRPIVVDLATPKGRLLGVEPVK